MSLLLLVGKTGFACRAGPVVNAATSPGNTVAFPHDAAVGDIALLALAAQSSPAITTPGWTLLDSRSGSQRVLAVYWRVLDGTEGATVSYSTGSGGKVAQILCFPGGDTATTPDHLSSLRNTAGTSFTPSKNAFPFSQGGAGVFFVTANLDATFSTSDPTWTNKGLDRQSLSVSLSYGSWFTAVDPGADPTDPVISAGTTSSSAWLGMWVGVPAVPPVFTPTAYSRTATDSQASTDTASRVASYVRNGPDSQAAQGNVGTRVTSAVRTGVDSQTTPTDVATRASSYARKGSDSQAAQVDSGVRVASVVRTGSDSQVAQTDSGVRVASAVRTSDDVNLSVQDAPSRAGSSSRTTVSSQAESDVAARVATHDRTGADAQDAGQDSGQRSVQAARTAADVHDDQLDTCVRVVAYVRGADDLAGDLADVASRVVDLARTVADVESADGDASRSVSLSVTATDATVTIDSAERQTSANRAAADEQPTEEDIATTAGAVVLVRTAGDVVDDQTDAGTWQLIATRLATAVSGAAGAASRVISSSRNLAAATLSTDSATRSSSLARAVDDVVTQAVDNAVRNLVERRLAGDVSSAQSALATPVSGYSRASAQLAPGVRTSAERQVAYVRTSTDVLGDMVVVAMLRYIHDVRAVEIVVGVVRRADLTISVGEALNA